MESKDIIGIAPFGPFVEGFIRFSFEEDLASKRGLLVFSAISDGTKS